MDRLRSLHGTWVGQGEGEFPTIDAFAFRETLRFEFDAAYPLLHYEQRTRLLPQDEASHWESGFLRVVEDGWVELTNAQDSGRVEVLRGRLHDEPEDAWRLELDSVVFGNDPRMQRSRRVLTLRGDTLTYVKSMATWTTPEPRLLQHLSATLTRQA